MPLALYISAAVLFILFFTIRPIHIKKLKLGMATSALLVLGFFLIFQIIDLEIVKQGILGNEFLQPWKILIIFFSTAYVCVSTDRTGIFDYLSYQIIRFSGNDGRKLFLGFYFLAGILTTFTSNDSVILTITPILFYLGKNAKLDITPYLFAEFVAANTFSMFLYIGNPTNIIVASAIELGYWEYTKIMAIPTIIAALVNYWLLRWVFRKDIPKKFVSHVCPSYKVGSWPDAIMSTVFLIMMLTILAFNKLTGFPIWVITLFFSFVFLLKDFYINFSHPKNQLITFLRVPWKILPFVTTFFILVAALNQTGLFQLAADKMLYFSQSMGTGIFPMGISGFFLANLINNQPMTIFMTNILLNQGLDLQSLIFREQAYSLIIASNLGANLTLIGALAGIMWQRLLEQKNLKISYFQFLKKGISITPITFIVTLISLHIVLHYIFP